MSLQPGEVDCGTADDWFFAGREPSDADNGGWSDPELWAGFPMVEPPDLTQTEA
ncbi:hypothetical protein [Micromonospora sp. NPDC049891]|uniref:hypothetical protein n=1 Tax=Micromonospora sp. NPDC049891 TaxID=3155655 RepID=UPI0033FEFE96